MELDVGTLQLMKLGIKLVNHKILQARLATNETVIRIVEQGRLQGRKRKTVYDDTYYAFEGIPYAEPPLGELRFRAPQPPKPWSGIKDCTNFSAKPIQKHFILGIIEGSEDCLYLNVYTKRLESTEPLPVMVWIHGGGYQIGEATRDIYAPDYFMQKDVVLVTVNYRLGAFGFLSMKDPDLDIPGNAGIKDQLMALKWVKANIHNFNGNPNNITLFGESAGGASTHVLMSSNKCKGLFHKAILQSGTQFCHWSNIPQNNWPYRLAVKCGYQGSENEKEIYRFLNNLDAKKIVSTQGELLTEKEIREYVLFSFAPTIEPYESEHSVIRKDLRELLKDNWSNDIPVIIGGNSFEGLFSYVSAHKHKYLINELGNCEAVLPEEIKKHHSPEELREMGLKLKEAYFNNKEPSLKETLMPYLDLLSYKHFWHSIHRALLARLTYAPQTPTYLYRFDFDSPFFNHYRILKCGPSLNSPEYRTIQRMIGMWVAFAKTSNPNCEAIIPTEWKPLQTSLNGPWKCLNISNEVQYIDLPESSKLSLWDSFYTKEPLL